MSFDEDFVASDSLRRRGGTGRRSGLKILLYTREQLGHCHLPTSGRLIERAHEVLTQPAGDSKLGQGANLLLVSGWDFNLDRWLHARMAVSARGRERLRARSFGAQRTLNSQRQSRSHLGGSGDSARSLRVDHCKSKRRARGNVLHANRRLVCLALCRYSHRPAGVSLSFAIVPQIKKAHAELKQATQRSTCLDYKSAAAEVVAAGDRKNSACRVVVTRLLDEGRACHAVIHVKARSRCRLARRAVDSWRWGRAEASAKADDYCVCASIFRAPVPTMMRVSTPMMHCCRPHAFCVPPQLCTSQAVEAAVSAPPWIQLPSPA